jgi:hypothetical protein
MNYERPPTFHAMTADLAEITLVVPVEGMTDGSVDCFDFIARPSFMSKTSSNKPAC